MLRSRFSHRAGVGLVGAIASKTLQGFAFASILGGFCGAAIANEGVVPSIQTPPSLQVAQNMLLLDDSGEAVTELQTKLANLGFYDGPITGYFGPLTEEAVIGFQQSRGLAADGVVGASTWAALQSSGTSTASDDLLQVGDAGTAVTDLQSRLLTLGYYQGAVDGVFGSLTESAVLAFQRDRGIYPDGAVGPVTQQALSQTNVAAQPPVGGAPAPFPSQSGPNPVNDPFVAQPQPVAPAPIQPASPVVAQLPPPDTEGPFSVLDLQWKLRNQGFYYGPLDGVMGEETQRAIAEAQAEYGLSPADLRN